VATVQHVHKLDEAKKVLLEAGKVVAMGNAGRLKYAGQVIGCDYSNAKAVSKEVDAFLFVGGGRFHAIGVTLATAKPTIAADPYERKAFSIESEARRILKKRWASIHEATQAKKVGVLVGLKAGQKRLDLALRIKESVESAGKKAIILALKEITPEALMQFPTIGAFVNTACPRLSLDDEGEFRKPLLTPDEMLVVLGKLRWEELCQKGWFES
jgi:2-(3-amino-3-carboxypropyl)histidine synthase